MREPITLIKLGGSIITNKEVPMMVRSEILARMVKELALAQSKTGEKYIVGHGQGSFAHAPAMQYRTMDGFINEESLIGMAVTQDSAMQLNRIVVRQFLSEHMPAISYTFSNTLVTSGREARSWSSEVLCEYLDKGLLPVTGGDVIADKSQGCTIWSTEKVLGHIAEELPERSNYYVKRIIHVTEVPGVLDADGQVIETITDSNLMEVKRAISSTKGFDVTGGMWHKIEESLIQARQGIDSMIISGLESRNLYKCLVGESFAGTVVTARDQSDAGAYRLPTTSVGLIN